MVSESMGPIEIGSLNAPSPNNTEFTGSSSGVFFVQTVFRAFTKSTLLVNGKEKSSYDEPEPSPSNPPSVDSRLISAETSIPGGDERTALKITIEPSDHGADRNTSTYGIEGHGLGLPPSQERARSLLMIYFRNWHPLYPFLHGPTLLDTVLSIYDHSELSTAVESDLRTLLCRAIVCQCVFNVAALDGEGLDLDEESRISSPTKLLSIVGYVSNNHDIPTIQALLAAQIYLIAITALRPASTVGGVLTRAIFHAGLHRCPYRYPQLPDNECEIRKRIFWSAYAADRYLSQALGHPLSINDDDIDVCVPRKRELHKPTIIREQQRHQDITICNLATAHLPDPPDKRRPSSSANSMPTSSNGDQHDGSATSRQDISQRQLLGVDILAHHIVYHRLTGEALDLFHKSLQNRTMNRERIMELQSEVHAWWNGLPLELQEEYAGGKIELVSPFTFYFNCLYNSLIVLINRPFLSLSPVTLEFRSSLQACVTASRQIILTLKRRDLHCMIVSWPGILSITWMAGLVLSFASALKSYPFSKASREIQDCYELLIRMDRPWNNAKPCSEALKSLFYDLKSQCFSATGSQNETAARGPQPTSSNKNSSYTPTQPLVNGPSSTKRRRSGGNDSMAQSKITRKSRSGRFEPTPLSGHRISPQITSHNIEEQLNESILHPHIPLLDPESGLDACYLSSSLGSTSPGTSRDLALVGRNTFGDISWESLINGSAGLDDWIAWGDLGLNFADASPDPRI